MGHERNIIEGEFSDMEVIDTKKSIKHDYKDKSRKREKLKENTKNPKFIKTVWGYTHKCKTLNYYFYLKKPCIWR